MENWRKSQKSQNLQTTLKYDLDVVYTCYSDEMTFKESEEHISDNLLYARPLPADSGHRLHQQNSKKITKNRQNCDFSIIDILLHSVRKYDFWPEMRPISPEECSKTI